MTEQEWDGSNTLLVLAILMGLSLYGFFTSLGGQSRFKMKLPEA